VASKSLLRKVCKLSIGAEVTSFLPDIQSSRHRQLGVPRTTNFQGLELELAAFTLTLVPVRKHVEAMATPDPLVEKQPCNENAAGMDAMQILPADIIHLPVSKLLRSRGRQVP